MGAKRAGASRQAIIGAGIGTVAGIFSGLWATVHALVGAANGEYLARACSPCGNVSIATWIGLLLGTAAKVALCSRWSGYSYSPCWSSAPSGYDLAPDTSIDDRLVTTRCSLWTLRIADVRRWESGRLTSSASHRFRQVMACYAARDDASCR